MKIKKNGQIIRLTESDLKRIVKKVLTEEKLNEQWYKDLYDEVVRNIDRLKSDVKRDTKKAISEIPDIPYSFVKLYDMLTDAKEWEQVKGGFKEMGKTLGIVDEAEGHDMKDKLKAALGKDTFEKLMKLAKAADE